jgi:chromate transporter
MSLIELLALIFSFNLMTFGNGPVMIPLLQTNLVDERGVLTVDQLLYAFTIARITPGQANTYVAAIGYMLFGFPGALLTMLAIMLPGYVMLPLLKGYELVSTARVVRNFTRGLTSASVGLIFAATVQIGRRSLTTPIAWAVFGVALILLYGLKWSPIVSLLVASAVGVVLKFWL